MIEPAAALRDVLVAAYRPFVLMILEDRGWSVAPSLIVALDKGESWLDAELSAHLELPFDEQRRGPLELFQESMRFPTEALSESGVDPILRDEVAASALPGDVYDLAPASSQAIGEDAWQAHMLWGAAKAIGLYQSD